MEKSIELTPLAEIGRGKAHVTDSLVEIETSGISGGLKAWLIGGEAVPVGNIVDGKLRKEIDTTKHNGILITQSGRQMLIGRYGEESNDKEETLPLQKKLPLNIDGIRWEERTDPDFSVLCRELRFILSNKNVYENYKKHHRYWVGENDSSAALALPVEENGEEPLSFLGKIPKTENGYSVICVDKETKRLYVPL